MTELPFGKLFNKIIDNRGKTCPTALSGTPLIATNCIKNDQLYPIFEKVRFVDDDTMKNWFRGHPKPGNILFVTKGTPGRVAWVPNPVNFCIAQDMLSLDVNEKLIYPKYLFAVLRSNIVQGEIENLHVGSLIPHFKKGDFDRLIIPILERPLQKYIGDSYFDFCLKIDLLQRNNKTLEEMAETLFRQWFVEEAEDSWEEVKLGGYVNLVSGYSYRSVDLNSSTKALVTLKNFDRTGGFRHDGFKEYTGKYKEDQVVVSGDLIVAHTDITQEAEVLGNPAIVISTDKYEKLVISTDLVKVVPSSYLSKVYLYFLMKTDEFKHYCLGASNGTTVMHLSKKALPEYEFKLPSAELLNRFTLIAQPLLEKININQKHIQQLETLRDTLLPKLMSGQLNVNSHELL
jgi:type I restriction enzyme S subunit